MLTQLSTVKARLGIDDFDVKYDVLLTNAIRAFTTQFDKECNRQFARTVGDCCGCATRSSLERRFRLDLARLAALVSVSSKIPTLLAGSIVTAGRMPT